MNEGGIKKKFCPGYKCNCELPLSYFAKNANMPLGVDTYCVRCNLRRRQQRQQERVAVSHGKFTSRPHPVDKYEQFKQEVAAKLTHPLSSAILEIIEKLIKDHNEDSNFSFRYSPQIVYERLFALQRYFCIHTNNQISVNCFMNPEHDHHLEFVTPTSFAIRNCRLLD